MKQQQWIRARWIIPISRPPILGGWLAWEHGRVTAIGDGECPGQAIDLGDVALLPQLVNAHTHLEFSHLTQTVGHPRISLTDWIAQVVATRTEAPSRDESIRQGIDMSRQFAVGLIGEITTPPSTYPLMTDDPHIVCFAEALGLSPERSKQRLDAAMKQLEADPWCGLSPHAPYSTTRETIETCVRVSKQTGRPLAMHVAESPAERDLLTHARGPFVDALRSMGVYRDELFPWGDAPFISLIDSLATSSRALLIHGNDLKGDEIERLARHHHLSAVYCPRTHAYFGYSAHPVDALCSAGVRVALGTDSLASNPDLSVWREVQFLLEHRQDLSPHSVLEMATLHGADALGYPTRGRIEVGCPPLLAQVPTTATTLEAMYCDFAINDISPVRLDV